jgi:hypothetical protein
MENTSVSIGRRRPHDEPFRTRQYITVSSLSLDYQIGGWQEQWNGIIFYVVLFVLFGFLEGCRALSLLLSLILLFYF